MSNLLYTIAVILVPLAIGFLLTVQEYTHFTCDSNQRYYSDLFKENNYNKTINIYYYRQ
jgi:hypothetical protein